MIVNTPKALRKFPAKKTAAKLIVCELEIVILIVILRTTLKLFLSGARQHMHP